MLAKPPLLNDDGQARMTFSLPGTTGQGCFALVLTKGCFEHHGPAGSTLTLEEIDASGWQQRDSEGNSLFLQDLEAKAPNIGANPLAHAVTLGIIMNRVTGARDDGDTKNCSALDQEACQRIKKASGLIPSLHNRASPTVIAPAAIEAHRVRADEARALRAEAWQAYKTRSRAVVRQAVGPAVQQVDRQAKDPAVQQVDPQAKDSAVQQVDRQAADSAVRQDDRQAKDPAV